MDRIEEELLKLDLLIDEVENPAQLVKAIKEEDWAKVKRMMTNEDSKETQA